MLKAEEKLISWINSHLVSIALVFTILTALWARIVGRNFVGIDFHFSLYDIPGNCNSILYRCFTFFVAERWADHSIVLIKALAYVGDFGVALLSLLLLRQARQHLSQLQVFLIITACLLSPVPLLYSVCGMRIDSICMCLLLLGLLFQKKGRILPAALMPTLAAILYPAYWPVAVGLQIYMAIRGRKKEMTGLQTLISIGLPACLLILSIIVENQGMSNGYYWGKIFLIDPSTADIYEDLGSWLLGMCRIYGYFAATFSLYLAFQRKKLRIPAILIQVLVLILVGWFQTSHFAV